MKLTEEQMKAILHGAVRVERDEEGWYGFLRMTEQMTAFANEREHVLPPLTNSGEFFELQGEIRSFSFEFIIKKCVTNRHFYSIDVFEDGNLTFSHFEHFEEENRHDVRVFRYEPTKPCRLTIRLPWTLGLGFRNFEVDGSYTAETGRKTKLLIYGDSITQGYCAVHSGLSYAAILSDKMMAEPLNVAIAGECFHPGYVDPTLDFKPDLITVAYGTNDWRKTEEPFANCEAFFAALVKQYPDVPVIYFSPIFRPNATEVTAKSGIPHPEACARFREIAARYGAKVVDGYTLTPHAREFTDDGLHPNDLGFAYMGNEAAAAVRRIAPWAF